MSMHWFVLRKIDDEMLLMKISIEIDKETLLRRVEYKYAVLQSNSKLTWEFVPRKVTSEQHANRILPIPRDQVQQLTGMYIQISGIFCLSVCTALYLPASLFCSGTWDNKQTLKDSIITFCICTLCLKKHANFGKL